MKKYTENKIAAFDKVTELGKESEVCDFVLCGNCGTVMLVDRFSSCCPVCKEETLCWQDDDNMEIYYDGAEKKLDELGYELRKGDNEMKTIYVSYEEGSEGTYTESELLEHYMATVDKEEYEDFDGWVFDMLRSGVFEKKHK